MKKTAVVSLFAVFVFFGFSAFAERSPDVRSLDRSSFDYSFSRADRETENGRWIEEARRGISLSVAAWERTAVALYEDAAEYEAARATVRAWSETELEERFTVWLRDRFFGREAVALKALLEEETTAANKRYLYITDAEGNILYDEETGDPLTVRPDDGDTLAAHTASWENELITAKNSALASYMSRMETRYPELLTYIPAERRASFMGNITAALSSAAVRVERELDALVSREERLFVARRTGDVWSLRKQSESEAAAAIVASLARETEAECDQALKTLQARVEGASAETGDLALAGKEWLAAYRTQFDRGLSAWEQAEQRFMVRRMEWERDAAKSYTENEAVWSSAFEKLAVERRAWEAKARVLFESGEEAFARSSATLERSISEAKAEFDRDASLRGQATADRARAWVDTYVTSCSVTQNARENMEFWAAKENGAEELARWTAIRAEYLAKATEARDALTRDYGLAIGSGAGHLRDVLEAGVSGEDFNLDEYQVELLRAKAVAAYWAKRVGIAEAVSAYATDISAGRATEAESVAAWTAAKAAYDTVLASYQTAQSALTNASGNVGAARDAVAAAAADLAAADTALDELNSEYALKMSVLATQSKDFLKEEIVAKYKSLLEVNGLLYGADAGSLRS
ncbi:MAG: hypothetical protein WCT14_19605, partial [Treponemataceae bacterium]